MPRHFCACLPTRNTVRHVLAPALVFIATSLDRGYQTDLWQHLARGRLIAQERAVISIDRFTFTMPGEPLVDNNWLTQLLYYGVYQIAGLEGVQWANVHGGFAVGLVLIFASVVRAVDAHLRRGKLGAAPDAGAAERQSQSPRPFPLIACLLVSAIATLVNPYGWNVYRYAGKLSAVGVARGIEEWLPPSPGSLNGFVFVGSLALLAVLVVASKRRPTTREICLL